MVEFASVGARRRGRFALATVGAGAALATLAGCAISAPIAAPNLKGSYSSTAVRYGQGPKNLPIVAANGKTGIALSCVGAGKATVRVPGFGGLLYTCDPAGSGGTGSVTMTLPASTHGKLHLRVKAADGTKWVIVIGTQAP